MALGHLMISVSQVTWAPDGCKDKVVVVDPMRGVGKVQMVAGSILIASENTTEAA